MALRDWETNLKEGKKLSRYVKEACLEAFSSLNKKMIEFEGSNISEALGKIEIEMNQQSSRKSKENTQVDIQEMIHIDLLKINEGLVNPSSLYQVIVKEVKNIDEKLPQIQKKMFSFELNERIEPSRFMVALMERYTQCIE
jgi:hypothetical protein